MGKIEEKIGDLLLSDDFAVLCSRMNKFNVFNVLKLTNAEIRHSNFLGWLLSPCENHFLGDEFLKELLKIALKDHTNNPNISIKLSDIIFKDFTDAEITLEKMTDEGRRMDIFIESMNNDFVCVIENKVWSGEGCNQLEDYEKYINSHQKYSHYKHKLFIFLTPNTAYDCTKLYKNYVRIDYGKICWAIDKVLNNKNNVTPDNVRSFIEDYKEMVERNIMGKYDKDTLELCAKMYKEYGDVIDLIYKYGNPKNECYDIFDEILNEKVQGLIKKPFESDCKVLALPEKIYNEIKDTAWLEFSMFKADKTAVTLSIVLNPESLSDDKKLIKNKFEYLGFESDSKGWEWSKPTTIMELDEYRRYSTKEDLKKAIKDKLNNTPIKEIIASFEKFRD